MSCPQEELLAARLADALAPDEEASLEAHLAGCAVCTDALAGMQAAGDALRALPLPEPSVAARERAYAAVMAAMQTKAAPVARPRVATPRRGGNLMALFAAAACVFVVAGIFFSPSSQPRQAELAKATHPPRADGPVAAPEQKADALAGRAPDAAKPAKDKEALDEPAPGPGGAPQAPPSPTAPAEPLAPPPPEDEARAEKLAEKPAGRAPARSKGGPADRDVLRREAIGRAREKLVEERFLRGVEGLSRRDAEPQTDGFRSREADEADAKAERKKAAAPGAFELELGDARLRVHEDGTLSGVAAVGSALDPEVIAALRERLDAELDAQPQDAAWARRVLALGRALGLVDAQVERAGVNAR